MLLKYYRNWLIAPVVLMVVGTTPLAIAREASPIQTSTPAPIPDSIIVKEFIFQGNTAFSDAELAKLTQDYTGRPLTFAELLEVESAVTKLYNDAGYINSGATIPADQSFSPEEGRGRTGNRFPILPFGTVLATFTAHGYWLVSPCHG